MKIKNKNIVFYFFLLTFSACSPTEPPNKGSINLQAEDVSCTEAWLKLETENINLPVSVSLLQNNIVGQIINLSKSDTIIYVDSLLPGKTYVFKVQTSSTRLPIGMVENTALSNEIQTQTLDTTRHSFTWETYTFGGGGSSVFNDVAIVNDTLAYAVGEIYLNDPTNDDGQYPYCIAKWNGQKWLLRRLYYMDKDYQGNNFKMILSNIKGILAFNYNNIWFADGSVFHWDGIDSIVNFSFKIVTSSGLLPGINRLWGALNSELYGVGNDGIMIHYSNNNWQKLVSGTSTIITDIWGITNDIGESVEYCTVSSFFTPGDKKILKIENNKVDSISWNVQRLLYSVWTNSDQFLYVCGSGAYENKKGYWEEINLPKVSMNAIRGNDLNDLFVAGDFGLVAHFNGSTWKIYKDIFAADYYSISLKGNFIILAGQQNGKGVITIGRRN